MDCCNDHRRERLRLRDHLCASRARRIEATTYCRALMRQLPLFALRSTSVFASYIPGPNQLAVDILRADAGALQSPVVWLYGAHAVGKTHLLQAICASGG